MIVRCTWIVALAAALLAGACGNGTGEPSSIPADGAEAAGGAGGGPGGGPADARPGDGAPVDRAADATGDAATPDAAASDAVDTAGTDVAADVPGTDAAVDAPVRDAAADAPSADAAPPDAPADTVAADARPTDAADTAVPFRADFCTADGWCWVNPLPQGRSLTALWMAGDGETVYAGGAADLILRHRRGTSATTWERVETPASISDVNSLWGSTVDDVWAVGSGGLVLHLEGGRFVRVDAGTTQSLTAVWGAGPDDLWAVGYGGTVLRRTGGAWALQTPLAAGVLRDVWGLDAKHVWAVGSDEKVFFWNGSAWSLVASNSGGEPLEKVRGSSPGDVWAVGSGHYGEQLGLTYHYDGTRWTRDVPTGSSKFFALSDIGAGGGAWAAAHRFDRPLATIWQLAGGVWTPFDKTLDGKPVAFAGRPGGAVWAVGYGGLLLHFETDAFAQPWGARPRDHLRGAWAAAAGDGWAVGYGGAVLRWDGTTWSRVSRAIFPDLLAVHGSAPDNVFLSGLGTLVRWDGQQLTSISTGGATVPFTVVKVASASEVWLGAGIGSYGGVWRWDGQSFKSWSFLDSPTGLWRAAANDVWALCGSTIQRWNGVSWTPMAAPGKNVLDMWGATPDDAWAVGAAGNVQHWDGHTFSPVLPKPATEHLRAIRASGPRDLWVLGDSGVVGEAGVVLHFDGAAWTTYHPDAGFVWKDLLVSAPGDVQVVSDFGAVMRRRP